jgi:hypothetical protein
MDPGGRACREGLHDRKTAFSKHISAHVPAHGNPRSSVFHRAIHGTPCAADLRARLRRKRRRPLRNRRNMRRALVPSALVDGRSVGSQTRVARANLAWRRVGGQRPDRPDRPAQAARQPLHCAAVHPAERGNSLASPTAARNCGPTKRAQTGRAGVTGSREGRRQENQLRARALRPLQIPNRMGRTGDGADRAKWFRPIPTTQVNAGLQCSRQPPIPRDDQRKPPCSADPCQIPAERHPCRIVVVA